MPWIGLQVWSRLVRINHMLLPAAVNIPFVVLVYIYTQLYGGKANKDKGKAE